MKKFFLFTLIVLSVYACDHKTNGNLNENQQVSNCFIFNDGDTCVYEFTYGKYIPYNQVDSASKCVSAEYVRYHDGDSTALIFTRDYIRRLCLNSMCVTQTKQDTVFGYGSVKEFWFPEAYLGFAYDEFEEMIVYSFINFADDIWYSDISSDGISVTSDVESALWSFLPYAEDSLLASANVYKLDEKVGVELDHTVDTYLNVWDITRKFYNYPMFDGVKKDDFIVYSNEAGLTFIRPVGSCNLKSVFFNGYTIEDSLALDKLEDCFMEKLLNLPVRDDIFVEQYEP